MCCNFHSHSFYLGHANCNSIYDNFVISIWPRSTMDSIRASEAPDPGSIPGEATNFSLNLSDYTRSNIIG